MAPRKPKAVATETGLVRGGDFQGFTVVEARPARRIISKSGVPTHRVVAGHFELARELSPGTWVRFSAGTAEKAMAQATAWLEAQARRKDSGHLAAAS